MNIVIKNQEDIKKMRVAGKIAAQVLDFIEPHVKPGVSTEELNTLCHDYIIERGCIPAPLNYKGFPKSICTSINNVVCHGIPSGRDVLMEGDIINIDITVIKDGYHGDTSRTFFVGEVDEEVKKLVERTEKAMMRGIEAIKPGKSFNEIGKAIEKYISKFNYGIVQEFTGHGIGKQFHEDPYVCHYDMGTPGPRMQAGMIFTVEPMINMTPSYKVEVDEEDGWTVYTADNALSAQFEHTVLVTPSGFEILTVSS